MTEHRRRLRGVLTALVTPMTESGAVDLEALDALVDWQLECGVNGLVPCGTTGEAVTLSAGECEKVVARVVARVEGRVPVLAGTGSNCTATVIENQKRALGAGADYGLVVTPYYNKPTQEGLYRHYAAAVAAVPQLPVVLYNVPGRTGCDLLPETTLRLAREVGDRIAGIKDATADLDRIVAMRRDAPAGFALLSGDDESACGATLAGGDGVISVASNVVPAQMRALMDAALGGNAAEAQKLKTALMPLFDALFLESNPIPVKTALAMAGRVREVFRLPLCEMAADRRARLAAVLAAGGWV